LAHFIKVNAHLMVGIAVQQAQGSEDLLPLLELQSKQTMKEVCNSQTIGNKISK
jgi:hypothetical protein